MTIELDSLERAAQVGEFADVLRRGSAGLSIEGRRILDSAEDFLADLTLTPVDESRPMRASLLDGLVELESRGDQTPGEIMIGYMEAVRRFKRGRGNAGDLVILDGCHQLFKTIERAYVVAAIESH